MLIDWLLVVAGIITGGHYVDRWVADNSEMNRRLAGLLVRGTRQGLTAWLQGLNQWFLNQFDRVYGGKWNIKEQAIWCGVLASPISVVVLARLVVFTTAQSINITFVLSMALVLSGFSALLSILVIVASREVDLSLGKAIRGCIGGGVFGCIVGGVSGAILGGALRGVDVAIFSAIGGSIGGAITGCVFSTVLAAVSGRNGDRVVGRTAFGAICGGLVAGLVNGFDTGIVGTGIIGVGISAGIFTSLLTAISIGTAFAITRGFTKYR